jgi:hypothetical protein
VFEATGHWVRPRTARVRVGGPHPVSRRPWDRPPGPRRSGGPKDRQSAVGNRKSAVQVVPCLPKESQYDPNVASRGPKTPSISSRPQKPRNGQLVAVEILVFEATGHWVRPRTAGARVGGPHTVSRRPWDRPPAPRPPQQAGRTPR